MGSKEYFLSSSLFSHSNFFLFEAATFPSCITCSASLRKLPYFRDFSYPSSFLSYSNSTPITNL
jgi:hypothetical protein